MPILSRPCGNPGSGSSALMPCIRCQRAVRRGEVEAYSFCPPMPIIQVKVKPNARVSVLEQQDDGSFAASLKAPPVDGKANAELVALVARHFGVPKSAVSIKAGAGGRLKLVTVAGA